MKKILKPLGDLGDVILWGDVETDGLDPYRDGKVLLQVAFYMTDPELNLLEEDGYEAFVAWDDVDRIYEESDDFIKNMHTSTGLWERLKADDVKPLTQIDEELTQFITQFQPDRKKVWWGGNSIKLDRDFADVFLPDSYTHIGHRSVDVSSVGFLARNWYDFTFEKKSTHNAKDDILESIEELKAYRSTIFR